MSPLPQAAKNAPVLVVGAGPTGLAAAAELNRRGIPAEVLERSNAIAASWRGRYDRLRLNTSKWQSTLSGVRYPKGTPVFPTRDQVVRYLEDYAERFELAPCFGVNVERVDPCDGGWTVTTSEGARWTRQVVFAIGYQHTPRLPDWPRAGRYPGRVLHSAQYKNPKEFQGADVLVVGAGCSGMEIANDLAQGGAARVRIAVRSQPNLVLRSWGWLPDDILIKPLFRLPPRKADAVMRFMRRWLIGDLAPYGLVSPPDGVFTGYVSKVDPSVVDMETVRALRARRIEVVPGVRSVDAGGVQLDDDTVIAPDAIVAATGYTSGLEPIVGHLGVLDPRGLPYLRGGPAARPGLRFMGYDSLIQNFYREACRVAEGIDQELAQPSPAQFSLS